MGKKITIDLGCGKRKSSNAIGVDIVPLEGIDVVADIKKGIPFKSSICDEIILSHVFEHLNEDERIELLKEIQRVLKPESVVKIWCPHKYAFRTYEDPTHKALDKLTLKMFDYFDKNNFFNYYFDFSFNITKKRIQNVVVSFPLRNIEIKNKHPMWIGLNFTLDRFVNFLANRWEHILKYIPTYQAELYFELRK